MRKNEEDVVELKKECLCKAPPALLKHCSHSPWLLDLPVPSPLPWQPEHVAALDARKLSMHALLPLRP
jgi:hypothetical protein